jgi:hypothetical protein
VVYVHKKAYNIMSIICVSNFIFLNFIWIITIKMILFSGHLAIQVIKGKK